MIIGAHSIIYSKDPEADRVFLREVLGFPHVDVGEGWLIFGLPPSEVAVHPAEENDVHEFYLMCEDVNQLVAAMGARGVACAPVQNQGWGLLTEVALPGGGKLGIYQPRHARPPMLGAAPAKGSAPPRAKPKSGAKPKAKSKSAAKAKPKGKAKRPAARKRR